MTSAETIRVTTRPCPGCGSTATLEVNRNRFAAWYAGGTLVQLAFPDMHEDDRERLVTGYCPRCWDAATS